MTTVGSAPFVSRFQDRTAYAQWLAAANPGKETAQQALARTDAEDLDMLKGAETTARQSTASRLPF